MVYVMWYGMVYVMWYGIYHNRSYIHGTNISQIPYVNSIRDVIFTNPYRGKAV